jgi:hypothetical protein
MDEYEPMSQKSTIHPDPKMMNIRSDIGRKKRSSFFSRQTEIKIRLGKEKAARWWVHQMIHDSTRKRKTSDHGKASEHHTTKKMKKTALDT